MRKIRILALDGGGIRGLFSATFLERFCRDAGINGNELWKYFDIICGTSTGGIQAIAYANGNSPAQIKDLFINKAKSIFKIRYDIGVYGGTLGPAGAGVLQSVIGEILGGNLPYIYQSTPLRIAISDVIGDVKMFQLKTNTLITTVGFTGGTLEEGVDLIDDGYANGAYFPYKAVNTDSNITGIKCENISNVLIPGFTSGVNYSCVDTAIATGAAPVYFHPVQIVGASSDTWYIDGGLAQNNPTALGYTMSQILFPQKVKTCILSVGTGYNIPNPNIDPPAQNGMPRIQSFNGLGLLGSVTGITLNCVSDVVDQQFKYMSLYKGAANNLSYYRCQRFLKPVLNPNNPSELIDYSQLDNPTPEALAYLQEQANLQYDEDFLRIQTFIQNSAN